MPKNFVPETASLSVQLRDLQRRSRAVLGHDLIRHPAAGALRDLGQTLLADLREIQEIRGTTVEDEPGDVRQPSLKERLHHSHRVLDTVLAQIALCESTTRQAVILLDWAQRLIAQEHVRYQELLPLFGRICDEMQPVSTLDRIAPLTGLPLAALVVSSAGENDAAVFIAGLTAARVLTWTLHDQPGVSERLSHIVLAALLEDVGRLMATSAVSAGRRFLAKRTAWLNRHHPSIGAAILGTIRGAPVGLGLMVSQHHERLDGGGYPRGLMPRDLHPDSAVLAAASRFAGICVEVDAQSQIANATGNVAIGAARKLLAEAEWGMWSVDFARRLSQRLERSEEHTGTKTRPIPQANPESTGNDLEPATTGSSTGDANRQLHSRERHLQGTHTEINLQLVGIAAKENKWRIDKQPS